MTKKNSNDFLVVRSQYTNEITVISVEENAFLNNGSNKLLARLDIAIIDYITSKIKDKKTFINLLVSKKVISDTYVDIYIVHSVRKNSDSDRIISFLEPIFGDDLKYLDLKTLCTLSEERILGPLKTINTKNKNLVDFASKLLNKIDTISDSSDNIGISGALLDKIKKNDYFLYKHICSYKNAVNLYDKENKKEAIIKNLSNYRVLRNTILTEKEFIEKENGIINYSKARVLETRLNAKYPLLVLASSRIDEYSNYDLSKKYSISEFRTLKKQNSFKNDIVFSSNQITFEDLNKKNDLGITTNDIKEEKQEKPNINRKQIVFEEKVQTKDSYFYDYEDYDREDPSFEPKTSILNYRTYVDNQIEAMAEDRENPDYLEDIKDIIDETKEMKLK